MGLSGAALRTAIGLTAGLSFLAFGYGQGKLVACPSHEIKHAAHSRSR